MAVDAMPGIGEPKIRLPEKRAPRGAKVDGIAGPGPYEGEIVYVMDVLDLPATKASKVQRIDPTTGEPAWKKNPGGEKITPILVIPKPIFRRKRFVLAAFRNQKVKMVENFEESAERREEREQRERVAAFSQGLAEEAVRRGFRDPAEMLTQLLGEPDEEVELAPEAAAMAAEAKGLIDMEEPDPTEF